MAPGEVHGFLGPNGAGKSTTLRVLLGLLRDDSGSATVFGLDPWRDATEIHGRLAYVPGDVSLWPNLSGGETIDLLLRMRGVRPADTRREELLERFGLDPTKKGRAYSKGNRQKVALVAAFAAPVELLVLDEPTSGLDPLMEQVFNECLAEHRDDRHDRAALQPHPERGRAAGGPGHHHPRGPDRGDRLVDRPAAPAAQPRPGGGLGRRPGPGRRAAGSTTWSPRDRVIAARSIPRACPRSCPRSTGPASSR